MAEITNLLRIIRSQVDNPDFCDVVLVCGEEGKEERLLCKKASLQSCPHFSSALMFKEGESNEFRVIEFDKETMKIVVQYICSETIRDLLPLELVRDQFQIICELLRASDYFQLSNLWEEVLQYVVENMTFDFAVVCLKTDLLALASQRRPIEGSDHEVIRELLEMGGLENFYAGLLENGFDTLEKCQGLTHSDLRIVGVTLFSIRDKIIALFRDSTSPASTPSRLQKVISGVIEKQEMSIVMNALVENIATFSWDAFSLYLGAMNTAKVGVEELLQLHAAIHACDSSNLRDMICEMISFVNTCSKETAREFYSQILMPAPLLQQQIQNLKCQLQNERKQMKEKLDTIAAMCSSHEFDDDVKMDFIDGHEQRKRRRSTLSQ